MRMIAALFVSFLIGCAGPDSDGVTSQETDYIESENKSFSTKIEWVDPLKAETFLSAEIKFKTADNSAITSLSVSKFDPTMPSMGHGTSTDAQVIGEASANDKQIKISGVWFNMSGPWTIAITASVNGKNDTVKVPIMVP